MTPPTAPPMPTPVKAAMIGPAAISGPTPGIANAPMPASQPSAPPTTAPDVAPVAMPSGALVPFSCAKSFVPTFSGSNTGNIGIPKALRLQFVDCVFNLPSRCVKSEDCFICHRDLSSFFSGGNPNSPRMEIHARSFCY